MSIEVEGETGTLKGVYGSPEIVSQRAQAEAAIQAAEARLASAQAKLASNEGSYQHLTAAANTPGIVAV